MAQDIAAEQGTAVEVLVHLNATVRVPGEEPEDLYRVQWVAERLQERVSEVLDEEYARLGTAFDGLAELESIEAVGGEAVGLEPFAEYAQRTDAQSAPEL